MLISKEQEETFDGFLSDFQPDIYKLVSSKRSQHHIMSVEEIVSDFNLYLIKKKDQIISYRDQNFNSFTFDSFKYIVCSYIKNIVKWYHCRRKEESYNRKRVNGSFHTPEGLKSSFDIISSKMGHDEKKFLFDDLSKIDYAIELLRDYSSDLTDNEIQIIDYLLKGLTQTEIAKLMNVTHQAISFTFKNIEEKIRNKFKFDIFSDCSWDKITNGYNAINKLFDAN